MSDMATIETVVPSKASFKTSWTKDVRRDDWIGLMWCGPFVSVRRACSVLVKRPRAVVRDPVVRLIPLVLRQIQGRVAALVWT